MKIGIYSFPHGITLNPRQWALDGEDGDIVNFDSVETALSWINRKNGEELTEDDWAEHGIHFGDLEEV
jgi:hypothetical protein